MFGFSQEFFLGELGYVDEDSSSDGHSSDDEHSAAGVLAVVSMRSQCSVDSREGLSFRKSLKALSSSLLPGRMRFGCHRNMHNAGFLKLFFISCTESSL